MNKFFQSVNLVTKNKEYYLGLSLNISSETCGGFNLKIIGEFYIDLPRARDYKSVALRDNEIVKVNIIENGLASRFEGMIRLTSSFVVTDSNGETKSDRQFWELIGFPNTISQDDLWLFRDMRKVVMRVFYCKNKSTEKVVIIVADSLVNAEKQLNSVIGEYELIIDYELKELDLDTPSIKVL
jgi:hypothetical protein